MASNFNEKLSSRQTAYNNAGAITVAMITAGLVSDKDEAKAVLKDVADTIYGELAPLAAESAPERAPAPASPGEYTFTSGKHDGKTIAEVAEEAPDYLDWYAANVKKGDAVGYVKDFLNSARAGV